MRTILLSIVVLLLTSCTENQRAQQFGGSMTIKLEPCTKLVTATWKKDTSLWYLTRPWRSGDVAERSTFAQKSEFGVLEGNVLFVEECK